MSSTIQFSIIDADGQVDERPESIIERILADLPFTESEMNIYQEN